MSGEEDAARVAGQMVMNASAVLFDFNGTVSLDEDLLEQCYDVGLTEVGLPVARPGEYDAMHGRSEPDIAAALLAARSDAAVTPDELLDHVAAAYVRACAERPRIPAAHADIVRAVHARGIPVAIVTGTLRRMIEPVLGPAGLADQIDALVAIEDITSGKPDPEGFLRGAQVLGVTDMAEVVVVEDSAAGVHAGTAAGALTVACAPAGSEAAEAATVSVTVLADVLPFVLDPVSE